MTETKTASPLSQRITERLPAIVLLLFVLQPLMDILSYWADRLGTGNTLTLGLRFLVLIGFALLGFCLSKRKRAYLIMACVSLLLMLGHVYACSKKGYLSPAADLTNFVRVMQMPLFVFCFITCMRRNRRCYRAIEKGCVVNFWIIFASLVLSLITNTASATYEESGFGVIGWFATTNAQSAILSILVPIVVTFAYRQRNLALFTLTSMAGIAQLYFLGTRLAYLSIAVTVIGLLIVAVITKNVQKKYFIVLLLLFAVAFGTFKLSPMYRNQTRYNEAMSSKQGDAEVMMARVAKKEGLDPNQKLPLKERIPRLRVIYRYYNKQLCRRFNVYRIMEAYNYTSQITKITATRHQKIIFCSLLMKEHPPISRVFGMELERMKFHNNNYDVENDFHGIYFLYGWAGLVLMIAFVGAFVIMIVLALKKNFRRYFTLEAGAFGMALCLALVYAYSTAGVLRRPNSSFYLSMLLAVVWYLTQMRYYPELSETEKGVQS